MVRGGYSMDINFPDNVKRYIELQCNTSLHKYTEFFELKHIKNELSNINPSNVLEIGSGIGRASVYLFKYFNWNNTNFYLLDGNSGDKQVSGISNNGIGSFYNSLDATREFCLSNGITNLYLLNAEKEDWKKIDVKFDICYSFLAVGFHWPVSLYLNIIYEMLVDNALLIFGIRSGDSRFDTFMDTQIDSIDLNKYEVLKLKRSQKYNDRDSVLILAKKGK